jgi:hypothetical protein
MGTLLEKYGGVSMKRWILLLCALCLFVMPIAPVVAQDQWVYGILLWQPDADADNEYVWNVSGLYASFDRDDFKEQIDEIESLDGTLLDYMAVFGLNGFELVGTVDNLAFSMYIFKKPY